MEQNPYQVIAPTEKPERSTVSILLYLVAGAIGYLAPILVLALLCSITQNTSVAVENLQRVLRMHSTWSLNAILAFLPNAVLACFAMMAAREWVRKKARSKQWLKLCIATLLGYAVVLVTLSQWNLIPWTWSQELHNGTRTAATLIFPAIVVAIGVFEKRNPAP